ncbi:hypothetical protein [Succinivibrio dextrinosolvens]|nr:hypothetical protein [Succinivibrio dextrinosolvens]
MDKVLSIKVIRDEFLSFVDSSLSAVSLIAQWYRQLGGGAL